MIDDITDGARWTIAQGYADPKRLCIYGGSYGGFAALASAVREPDLYRCVIGYAGVYDLKRWRRDSDAGSYRGGRTYIEDFVGADSDALKDAKWVWTEDKLHWYLSQPAKQANPGTKMKYSGLDDAKQLDDLIAYLQSNH
jgi:S-formylglutathione hydrolase FrmB